MSPPQDRGTAPRLHSRRPSVWSDESVGGTKPSDESPWWLFHRVTQYGLAKGHETRAEIRQTWRPLQHELLTSAYEMARRGHQWMEAGRADEARRVLSPYVADGVSRMLAQARRLLAGA